MTRPGYTTPVLLAFLLAIVVMLSLFVWFAWDRSFANHDGVQYVSTAINIFQGRGFATGSLVYDGHYQSVLPAPQTVWPNGFPLLISTLLHTGIAPERAALLINLAAHSGAAFCIFFILLRCGIIRSRAILAAVGFLLFVLPWKYAGQLLADPVMSFLILLTLAFLPGVGAGLAGKQVMLRWLVCGLLCTLLICTRYSAVLFVAVAFIVVLFFLLLSPIMNVPPALQSPSESLNHSAARSLVVNRLSQLLLLTGIPTLAFAGLLYRNYAITGSFLPNNGQDIPLTVVQTVKKFFDGITGFLGIDNSVLPHLLNNFLSVLIVLLVVGISLYSAWLLRKPDSRNASVRPGCYRVIVIAIIIIHTLFFTAYFIHKSLTPAFPQLVPRYVFQVFGGIYLLFCLLVASALQHSRMTTEVRAKKLVLFLLAVLFGAIQLGQVNAFSSFNRYHDRHQMIVDVLAGEVAPGRSFAQLVAKCFEKDPIQSSLWSTEGQLLHYYTGVSTLTLPGAGRFSKDYDKQTIAEHIAAYDVKLMAVIDSPLRNSHIQPVTRLRQWFSEMGFQSLPIDTRALDLEASAEVFVVDRDCI